MGITLLLALEIFSAIKFDLMKISFLGPAKPIVWCWYDFISYMNNDILTAWKYLHKNDSLVILHHEIFCITSNLYTRSTKGTDSISVKE